MSLQWHLLENIFSCALQYSDVRPCEFPGVPVRFRALSLHPNQPLLDIISQLRVILCIRYGLESAFVVDLSSPYILNVPNWPLLDICLSFE